MTLLVPALIGAGVLTLAFVGRKKSQQSQASSDAFDPTSVSAIPKPITTGSVSDPSSPAAKMASGPGTNSQAPIMRGAPPSKPAAPPIVYPVPTARAPVLGVRVDTLTASRMGK